ncbi:MAG: hypothetical protein ABF760_07615 [Zymomonas mobilis]|uniref:HEPN domain-containing protein n=1 Tax=Zymomonas mobilis TaxID=542 RepID=A0A542W0T5_ZYMMB|nr:hypothetical protein [Zymomonas mobilis]TQL17184.1 hypothetical protein FBY58_0752 [Zymomonas mobilis]
MLKQEQIGDIQSSKNNLIRELFVRTADENYITARWCAINQLNVDFFWLSVHALEKYLKAVLLINGQSAISRPRIDNTQKSKDYYGHNIKKLYADVEVLSKNLLPNSFSKPNDLQINRWTDKKPKEFIEHLFKNGNADNRYMIHGYLTDSQDLHMLDQMVFVIRRLICPLNQVWGIVCKNSEGNKDPNISNKTNKDMLAENPKFYKNMGTTLDNLIETSENSPKRIAALNFNIEFAPNNYHHTPISSGNSFRERTITSRIITPLKSQNPDQVENGIEVAHWFLENIKIPKEIEKEIRKAMDVAGFK